MSSIYIQLYCLLVVLITQSHCLQTPRLRTKRTTSSSQTVLTTSKWKNAHQKHTSPLSMSSQPQNQESKPLYIVELTPQERILKEALGIEPESAAEKEERQRKRMEQTQKIQNEKRKNIGVAILAFTAACLNYFWQYTHPVTSLSLLTEMQRKSDDITLIGKNGKPTVVDFWAPWCENCKTAAPTLSLIEDEYRNRVNFVMVNGDLRESWPMIERFGVDAIPHLAMIGSDGYVETALIGPIPRNVLRADLDVMIENGKRRNMDGVGSILSGSISSNTINSDGQQQQGKIQLPYAVSGVSSSTSSNSGEDNKSQEQLKIPLPYTMYDAFRSRPDLRTVSFSRNEENI